LKNYFCFFIHFIARLLLMNNFNTVLYNWYGQNSRKLPWRTTNDPYCIWVSEIILQQTRINQGLPYYFKFLDKFPDIISLANSSEDELLKVWEGLGYYSRARNMHFTAKMITSRYHGVFPASYDDLRHLKGIGDYTAAAVASFAFNLKYPTVDGNVIRFISRYFGITEPAGTSAGRKYINQKALALIDPVESGKHNQAMMEFGALQCIPSNPDCRNCPFLNTCFAFQNHMVDVLPAKSKSVIRKIRYFYFFFIENVNEIIMEKRTGNDIWKNLYQFPLYESAVELLPEEIPSIALLQEPGKHQPFAVTDISRVFRHELTHQRIVARFVHLRLSKLNNLNSHWLKVNKKEIHKFAYPVLIRNYLNRTGPEAEF
jgi:A/G-specific adenine glycosylase